MFEPRCPTCTSPEIDPDPGNSFGRWRCRNCGERFDLESAFVQIREALDLRSSLEVEPLFHFDRDLAAKELRDPDGALRALSPFSEGEEIDGDLTAARRSGVIQAARSSAGLGACSMPRRGPRPLLCVDPGIGPWLLGRPLPPEPRCVEDPIGYTVRWLELIVEAANRLVGDQLLGASRREPGADLDTDGPRSHRPESGRGQKRRYIATAYWVHPSAPAGEQLRAEGFSIAFVLGELGERIEDANLETEAAALEVTVSWGDEPGTTGQEGPR